MEGQGQSGLNKDSFIIKSCYNFVSSLLNKRQRILKSFGLLNQDVFIIGRELFCAPNDPSLNQKPLARTDFNLTCLHFFQIYVIRKYQHFL